MSLRYCFEVVTGVCFHLVFAGALLSASPLEPLLTIEPGPGHVRNSEGDIELLRDGSLCFIYTQFSDSDADHAGAVLVQRLSRDDGRTWSEPKEIARSAGGQNVMSVSLFRLQSGGVALFYLDKISNHDCRPVMRVSKDEARTWGKAQTCIIDEVSYYVMNNDRAVQLESGRLLLPVAQHKIDEDKPSYVGTLMCYLSDDEGATWRRSKTTLQGLEGDKRFYVQEPGVVALGDGRLWMYCRTDRGFQYGCYSTDGGDTWSPLAPTPLASPQGPATVKRIPWSGKLISLWNDHSDAHPFKAGLRTPWCVAVSGDGGRSFGPSVALESNPERAYAYSSATFHGDKLFVTYGAGEARGNSLGRLVVATVPRAFIDQLATAPASKADPQSTENDLESYECLDFGRSFVLAKAGWNSPRFMVESRVVFQNAAQGKSEEYLQCGSCKSENTYTDKDLFTDNNYDFLPVFGPKSTVIFRKEALFHKKYREVKLTAESWGGVERKVRLEKARALGTPDEIRAVIMNGEPLVGQTELRDEKTGNVAIVEFPIKTFNWSDDKRQWQVDTGPLLLPDVTAPVDKWAEAFEVAFVAYKDFDDAEFIVRGKTTVNTSSGKTADVHHYSRKVKVPARNRLLTYGEATRK